MKPTNQEIAQQLRKHASELARAKSNLYRVRAFRSAAFAVMGLPGEVATILERGGAEALERVPGIGKSLAETIAGFVARCEHVSRPADPLAA
jgi:holliday junction DNA helicase RuvA